MMEHAPVLIIVLPLMAACFNIILGLWKKELSYPWTVLVTAVVFGLSLVLMNMVMTGGTVRYRLGGWAPPWGIEYVVDHLNAFIAVIVSFIGFIVAVYSRRSIEKELQPGRIIYFYSVYLLLITGLLGITLTGDVFNIYVFLEISSLAGYALIAIGDDRAPLASFNYVIMGTIGACFYLLGVGYLYLVTGSLNMADLSRLLPELYQSRVVFVAFAFFMVGVAIKMAFFPLHIWLPSAYTHAPSTVSALAASTMTKVGAYVMIRIMYTVFKPSFSLEIIPMSSTLGWAAATAMVAGSILALSQVDFKRMLSYMLVAEVGYIVMGVSRGNSTAFTGAVLHILNDAFMMACLFLVAGAVMHRKNARNITDLAGLHREMPWTMLALFAAALSMVGVPPTAGFFSKWYLILGTIKAGEWVFAAAFLLSSLLNAVMFYRVLETVYFKGEKAGKREGRSIFASNEIPLTMLGPILVMAAGVLLLGFFSGDIIESVIRFTVPEGF